MPLSQSVKSTDTPSKRQNYDVGFFSSLTADHLERYSRVIQEGIAVRQHSDLLRWLQGEIQHFLPHEIMLAAWGDFGTNFIHHDIVSALPGVRTAHLKPACVYPWLQKLYNLWVEQGRMPCDPTMCEGHIASGDSDLQCSFGKALQGMRSSLLHGISDRRGRHDCLYIIFSSREKLDFSMPAAMEILLPYLDTALRRVAPLAHGAAFAGAAESVFGLSERENQIMDWVRMGKTNSEIGSILSISAFTVKNHLQHIFKKLDVYNRMQAVSKMERVPSHG